MVSIARIGQTFITSQQYTASYIQRVIICTQESAPPITNNNKVLSNNK